MQHTFPVDGEMITVQIPEGYRKLMVDETINVGDLLYNPYPVNDFLPASNKMIYQDVSQVYCAIRKETTPPLIPTPDPIKNNYAKICVNCQHHISEGFDAYRNFNHHCHKFSYKAKNIVTGKITIENILSCESARNNNELCGFNAKFYIEKNSECNRPPTHPNL